MKKQTAVEWLVERITKHHDKSFQEFYGAEITQALEMEKEQIVDAYGNEEYDDNGRPMSAEQYYNETYNADTQ
jgi:hypothetical protein